MKSIKLFISLAALLLTVACNAQNTSQEKQNSATSITKQKSLIVFFSHAGDNYAVGNIPVGNTKIVADYITELIGADQFEIVTHKYDGMAYKPLCDLARQEKINGELPTFEGSIDVAPYQTIFIGGPVWWGTYPQVMFSFFKQYDLSGKTIIPFTTHEGSGLGSCVDDLRQTYPNATITGEFSIYGHEVRTGKSAVKKWLNSLKLTE